MRLLLGALVLVFIAGHVWAGGCITKPKPCPGPDAAPINDYPYSFTYESWDKDPTSGGKFYMYGRCVENKRAVGILKIDWLEPQTSGSACPNDSVKAVFPFFTKESIPRPSRLYYGNAGDNKIVNYVAHVSERSIKDAGAISANEKATLAALDRANGTLEFDSTANLSVPADSKVPDFSLVAVDMAFTSRLTRISDGTLRYDYSFTYHAKPAVDGFDARVEDIRFGTVSKAIGAAMMNGGLSDTKAALEREKGHIEVFLISAAAPRSTVTPVYFFDRRGEVVGSIPVSIFYPANLGP